MAKWQQQRVHRSRIDNILLDSCVRFAIKNVEVQQLLEDIRQRFTPAGILQGTKQEETIKNQKIAIKMIDTLSI